MNVQTVISPQTQTTSAAESVKSIAHESVEDDFSTEGLLKMPLQCKLSVGAPNDPLEDEADNMADQVMRMPDTSFIQRKCNCEDKEQVQRKSLLPIQFKLSVGDTNDPMEEEADSMADQVMRMPDNSFVQRKCAPCDEKEKEGLQRKPLASFIQKKSSDGTTTTSNSVTSGIESSRGNGNAMSASSQNFMESRFGADFSDVRIHDNGHAAGLSKELNAQAFTVGSDIYFNQGKYAPESTDGKHLLAHELTHTIQQGYSSEMVQQKPDPKKTDGIEKCMAQSDLLPHTGLLQQINRDVELETALGGDRNILEQQIMANKDARRFVCEAGVPAIIALYDTRFAEIRLAVECARQALSAYPQHYSLTARNKRRDEVIPVAYAPFDHTTPLAPVKSGKPIKLDPGRQLRILSEDKSKNTFLVRVISGPQHCKEGFININIVKRAEQSTLKGIEKVTLVFAQNPERTSDDIIETTTGLAARATRLRIVNGGSAKDTFKDVPKDSHVTLDAEQFHTATEYSGRVQFEMTGQEKSGFIPKADVISDSSFRRSHRTFFIRDVGLNLANNRKSIFVDLQSQLCSPDHLPIEFFTGRNIVKGILAAARCTGKLVDEVHIVGHGGPHGMGATGNVTEQNGIYIQQVSASINTLTAFTATDFAAATKNALANNVRFWLHACKTADEYYGGTPGYASQLGSALRKEGGHTDAIAAGLHGRGPADKGIKRVYPFILFPGGKEELFPR